MKDFITKCSKRNFIKIDNKQFSPLIEASTELVLDYCESVADKREKNPFILCFPEKNTASLWIAILLLTNYFVDDYIESDNTINYNFKHGDLIDIHGSIAEFIEFDKITEIISIKFKDGVTFKIKRSTIRNAIKKTDKNQINQFSHFAKKKKLIVSKRNSISKILFPEEIEIINEQILDSKVLLITGRGNTNALRQVLNSTIVYEEPLSKVFRENENLIIKPDLEHYKDMLLSDYNDKYLKFVNLLTKLLETEDDDEFKERIIHARSLIDNINKITSSFHHEFLSIIEDYEDVKPKLEYLIENYPGIQEDLPTKLRAVIINDINQIDIYNDTIHNFLNEGIPVILLTNRVIESVHDYNYYVNFFKNNPDCNRINWNKKKLNEFINNADESEKYIDEEFWSTCCRYVNQKIKLNIFEGNKLDTLLPKIKKEIGELKDFDILQKAFHSYFYPAIYALKNSITYNDKIYELVQKFQEVFNKNKNYGIEKQLCAAIDEAINVALNFKMNDKQYKTVDNIFVNNLVINNNESFFIPNEKNYINIPSIKTSDIIFTGYPFNEYSGHYLLDAICTFFIPDIKVLCWPYEANLTYGYIKRRLLASYFTDKLNFTKIIPEQYLLKNSEEFLDEIDSYLFIEGSEFNEEELGQEDSLVKLNLFKYKEYSSLMECRDRFTVKCNILNFDDGSFMFLPDGSTLLSEVETSDGSHSIKTIGFNELSVGLRIFKYKKDRSAYREISKNIIEVKNAFAKLELWKEALDKVFKECGQDIEKLEEKLFMIKNKYKIQEGNPVKNNVQRWLFDDELISPDNNNIRIILHAASMDNIEDTINDLFFAFNTVKSFTIRLSSNIKKSISRNLTSIKLINQKEFKVNINGVDIDVDSRIIIALEKSQMEVEYAYTRKILC